MNKAFVVVEYDELIWECETTADQNVASINVFVTKEAADAFVKEKTRPLTEEELRKRWESHADWARTEPYWSAMLSKIDETKINHNEFIVYERDVG